MSHDKMVNINTLVSEIDQQKFAYSIGGFRKTGNNNEAELF
ncbi:hypothetical protein [Cognaticolwellia mytili]|nr:hypothetical protein [Cognaticolwellia mytili]